MANQLALPHNDTCEAESRSGIGRSSPLTVVHIIFRALHSQRE